MGLTQQDVAGVLAYLLAAQAITATDGQVVVWHDYLTHTVPGLDAAELRPACRDAFRCRPTRPAHQARHDRECRAGQGPT